MRRFVVLLSLSLSFIAPLAIPDAQAGEPGTAQAQSQSTSCKRRRAKKQHSDSKPKKKDKDKDGKKPYGFEL